MAIINYLKEIKSELKQVNWPTRRQTLVYTAVVIIFSLAIALVLGLFDTLFNFLIKLII